MVKTLPNEYYEAKKAEHKSVHLEIAEILARASYLDNSLELFELSKWFKKQAYDQH